MVWADTQCNKHWSAYYKKCWYVLIRLENQGLLALRQLSMFRTCKRFATLASFEISVYVSVTQIFIPCHWREIFGCWFDSRLSMASHITKLFASLFYPIYNIRWIRKYLSRQSTEILVLAFITSRLDYCNGFLYGLPDCLLNELQQVQNACTRLIFREQKFCHITPFIYELYWLPIKYRIEFKYF